MTLKEEYERENNKEAIGNDYIEWLEKRLNKVEDKYENSLSSLLSIYDSLKLHDQGNLYNGETLTETMFRKMSAYDLDLNKELNFTHLRPVTKNN